MTHEWKTEAMEEIARLEAEVERLRAALKDIEFMSHPTTFLDDEGNTGVNMPSWVKMGERARQALEEK